MSTQRSLLRRLLWGFSAVLLLVWVALIALTVVTALRSGSEQLQQEVQTTARQIMSALGELTDRPAAMARVVAEVERLEREGAQDEPDALGMRLQMWHRGKLLYTSPGMPFLVPAVTEKMTPLTPQQQMLTWVEHDPDNGLTLRVAIDNPVRAVMQARDLAMLLLPLAVCLPLLIFPAWYLTRRGMQPLRAVVWQLPAERRRTSRRLTIPPIASCNPSSVPSMR